MAACRMSRAVAAVGASSALTLGLVACGSGAVPVSATRSTYGYAVTYRFEQVRPSGELNLDGLEMLTDGRGHLRLSFVGGDGEILVTDSVRALVTYPNASFERTGVDGLPASFVVTDADDSLAAWCTSPVSTGVDRVLSRPATRYRCTPNGTGWAQYLTQVWVDRATRLVMGWVSDNLRATATKVDLHAPLTADTFSLQRPTGGQDLAHPLVQPFTVPKVGGGNLAWADYRGHPALVLVGSAPGLRAMLRRVQPMVGDLATTGLLVAEVPDGWRGTLLNPQDAADLAATISSAAGTFPVPVGIDIKGAVASTLAPEWSRASGLTALVLIRADGAVARVTDDSVSDDELRSVVTQLEEPARP